MLRLLLISLLSTACLAINPHQASAQSIIPIKGTKYFCITDFNGIKSLVSDPGDGTFPAVKTENVVAPIQANITKLNKSIKSINSKLKTAKGSTKTKLAGNLKAAQKKLNTAKKQIALFKSCL